MWSTRTRQTALTSPAANWFFQNENIQISDERGGSDSTMLSTLRFLLNGKTETGSVRVLGVSQGESVEDSNIAYRLRRFYTRGNRDTDSFLMMVECRESADNIKEAIERTYSLQPTDGNLLSEGTVLDFGTVSVNSEGEEVPLKLKYQPALTFFFGGKFGVYAFLDTERRIALAITSVLNTQKYHWMQAVLPMLMPWYWADENGEINIGPEAFALLEKLNSQDVDGYLQILQEFADRLEIERKYNDEKLKGFLNIAQTRALNNAREDVERYRRRADELMEELGSVTRSIREKLAYVTGLELATDDTKASEFATYISNNSAVKTILFDDNFMRILCHGHMEYYDTDPLEDYLENKRSMIYANTDGTKLQGKIEKLLRALFIDETLRIRVCAEFDINVAENRVRAKQGADYPEAFRDYYPNPHIEGYGCIDGYVSTMAQYVAEGNFVGAVEQCIASTQTMNFHDSTVCGRLIRDFVSMYDTRECIMLPDGSYTTIEKAIEYLEKEEGENN